MAFWPTPNKRVIFFPIHKHCIYLYLTVNMASSMQDVNSSSIYVELINIYVGYEVRY
jgi:hypothetical protein